MTKLERPVGDEGARAAAHGGATQPRRCRWCRRVIPAATGRGRPREFCSQRCRQWDWVARQRAAELELSDNELIIARDELDRLHDDLYILACAVDDTLRDLNAPGKRTQRELDDLLAWLLEAATPLRDRTLNTP
ncbi:MAG: hypothetical protein ACE37B_01960 [Ilumatobacter sp.]|uniref:hypothetical protein n=1 Tax=Ilumatobacter sp. TaxID=1967498 RepID=UPI00391D275C